MGEMFIIVDDNDSIIDHKAFGDIKTEDIYRVAGLCITNKNGEILLAKRSMTKKNSPGRWGPAVSGTVEEGESYEENIIKETEEELGLEGIRPVKGLKMRVRGEHNYFGQWFMLELDKPVGDFRLQKEEVDEVRWIPEENLKKEIAENPNAFTNGLRNFVEKFVK